MYFYILNIWSGISIGLFWNHLCYFPLLCLDPLLGNFRVGLFKGQHLLSNHGMFGVGFPDHNEVFSEFLWKNIIHLPQMRSSCCELCPVTVHTVLSAAVQQPPVTARLLISTRAAVVTYLSAWSAPRGFSCSPPGGRCFGSHNNDLIAELPVASRLQPKGDPRLRTAPPC